MECSGKSNRIIPHLRLEVVTPAFVKAPDSLFITHHLALVQRVAVVCQVPLVITNFTVRSPAQFFHMTTHRFCVCELLTDNWCASFPLASEGSASEG